MPSANTKPIATRISNDLYWDLLKQAAENQRTISKHLEAVLKEYLKNSDKPQKKAEKGGEIFTEATPPLKLKEGFFKQEEVVRLLMKENQKGIANHRGINLQGWSDHFAIYKNKMLCEAFASGNSAYPILYRVIDVAEVRERVGYGGDTKLVFPKYRIEYGAINGGIGKRWRFRYGKNDDETIPLDTP